MIPAVRDVSLCVKTGEILCILGESGCGKTVLCKSVMHLLPSFVKVDGSMRLFGKDIAKLSDKQMQDLRGSVMSMIFQDPMASLNPAIPVGKQIMEMIRKHHHVSKIKAKERALKLLQLVGIEDATERFSLQPQYFSGGMCQRIAIATALAANAKLLFADEITTALDPEMKTKVLDLLLKIRKKIGISIVFVTHDLESAARIADRVVYMYQGKIVEENHPYVKALFACRTPLRTEAEKKAPVSSKALLEFRHVCETFHISHNLQIKAIEDLSFTIKKGEIFGLAGKSGCGKTTTARLACGLYRPTKGEVLFEGSALCKRHSSIQLIFQNPASSFNPAMTMKQSLEEPLRIRKVLPKKNERAKLLSEIMHDVGLSEEFLYSYPDELSDGQLQRAAIARCLITRPKLIIADEPTASLDLSHKRQILELFLKLRKEKGISFLFISHDLPHLEQICDRICIMQDGKQKEIVSSPLCQ